MVEHWTSNGEHFNFRYDFAQRTSLAVDVLGRELEVHYNDDRLVIASRDYGGEHYAMDLDEAGKLIGITLPDGNKLAFKYDDFSRLIEETDPVGRQIGYKHQLDATLMIEAIYPDGSVWKAQYFGDETGLRHNTCPHCKQEKALGIRISLLMGFDQKPW